jgi:hypothetical protein
MALRETLAIAQPIAIIVGSILAVATYVVQQENQKNATQRELRRPYDEKQLALYLEASRIVAHLAAMPDVEREKHEIRFWELYWGELAFVESRVQDAASSAGQSPTVEQLMVEFCERHFGRDRCHAASSGSSVPAAINLSRQASDEIRVRWTEPATPAGEPWFQLTVGRQTILKLD